MSGTRTLPDPTVVDLVRLWNAVEDMTDEDEQAEAMLAHAKVFSALANHGVVDLPGWGEK